ncbi:hypothetical protein TrispH2_007887, partial [Trichoplax sp. H2]
IKCHSKHHFIYRIVGHLFADRESRFLLHRIFCRPGRNEIGMLLSLMVNISCYCQGRRDTTVELARKLVILWIII